MLLNWEAKIQGLQGRDCQYNANKKCMDNVPQDCSGEQQLILYRLMPPPIKCRPLPQHCFLVLRLKIKSNSFRSSPPIDEDSLHVKDVNTPAVILSSVYHGEGLKGSQPFKTIDNALITVPQRWCGKTVPVWLACKKLRPIHVFRLRAVFAQLTYTYNKTIILYDQKSTLYDQKVYCTTRKVYCTTRKYTVRREKYTVRPESILYDEKKMSEEEYEEPEKNITEGYQPKVNEIAQNFLADLDKERSRLSEDFPLCALLIEEGPKGNSLRRLQEETQCKIFIKGRNSMRDRNKEEELRNSADSKYAHLNKDLHVEISTVAPPAECYARIAYALAEVRKYLIPDKNDEVSHEQLRELMEMNPELAKTSGNAELFKSVFEKPGGTGVPKYLRLLKHATNEGVEETEYEQQTKRPMGSKNFEYYKASSSAAAGKRSSVLAHLNEAKRVREGSSVAPRPYTTKPYSILKNSINEVFSLD
uniref:KHDC4/BBP-like KH-domain type I domain-containing protein n=1 Tax=Glossina palpalis gambiensis TaxID=67801 RepID=A0A1B0BEQ0_9MUSC